MIEYASILAAYHSEHQLPFLGFELVHSVKLLAQLFEVFLDLKTFVVDWTVHI